MTATAATASAFRHVGGLEVLAWPALDPFGVDALVTTRWGGVSQGPYSTLNLSMNVGDEAASVLENRRRVAAALGAGAGDFVFADQVHGSQARVVSASDRGSGAFGPADAVSGTDALVTADPGIVLAVMAADCAPIVLYDPRRHVVACVHAGWRGSLARVAASAVAAMRSLGTRPENVIACLGPVIAPDRYQVGAEVAEAAGRCFGDRAGEVIRPDRRDGPGGASGSRWLFDVWAANRLVLRDAGVPGGQIHATDVPTGATRGVHDGAGWFFSDRAERPCGRFAAVARLRPRRLREAG
ncbi:MAG TPA: polyphenol oxidase family protein [Streptosporangiaceae bacterium]|nr:polyphenol oxidase family protein [Streptosporangiaceae bacterium]